MSLKDLVEEEKPDLVLEEDQVERISTAIREGEEEESFSSKVRDLFEELMGYFDGEFTIEDSDILPYLGVFVKTRNKIGIKGSPYKIDKQKAKTGIHEFYHFRGYNERETRARVKSALIELQEDTYTSFRPVE